MLYATLKHMPDLIVICLQSAGENGYELCRNLRKPLNIGTVPVIFVGARDEENERIKVLRCGGTDYLKLPMSEEECWLRIEQYLQNAQMLRQLEAERATLHRQVWSYRQSLCQQQKIQHSLGEEIRALRRLAFVDELTQVANRYSFNQTIEKHWQEADDTGQPLSLLMCDIDYFKHYNDTYGHLGGDACLQAVAQALVRGAHRQDDQVARYGGEEFAILLPATGRKGAKQVALNVRSELERLQIPHKASDVSPYVTLSIGICTLVPNHLMHSYDVLIHGADEALYKAKLWGRDRAVLNSPQGSVLITSAGDRYCQQSGDKAPLINCVTKTAAKITATSALAKQPEETLSA